MAALVGVARGEKGGKLREPVKDLGYFQVKATEKALEILHQTIRELTPPYLYEIRKKKQILFINENQLVDYRPSEKVNWDDLPEAIQEVVDESKVEVVVYTTSELARKAAEDDEELTEVFSEGELREKYDQFNQQETVLYKTVIAGLGKALFPDKNQQVQAAFKASTLGQTLMQISTLEKIELADRKKLYESSLVIESVIKAVQEYAPQAIETCPKELDELDKKAWSTDKVLSLIKPYQWEEAEEAPMHTVTEMTVLLLQFQLTLPDVHLEFHRLIDAANKLYQDENRLCDETEERLYQVLTEILKQPEDKALDQSLKSLLHKLTNTEEEKAPLTAEEEARIKSKSKYEEEEDNSSKKHRAGFTNTQLMLEKAKKELHANPKLYRPYHAIALYTPDNEITTLLDGKRWTKRELLLKGNRLNPKCSKFFNSLSLLLKDDEETILVHLPDGSKRELNRINLVIEAIKLNSNPVYYSNLAHMLYPNKQIGILQNNGTVKQMGSRELALEALELWPEYSSALEILSRSLSNEDPLVNVPIGNGSYEKMNKFQLILRAIYLNPLDSNFYYILASYLPKSQMVTITYPDQKNGIITKKTVNKMQLLQIAQRLDPKDSHMLRNLSLEIDERETTKVLIQDLTSGKMVLKDMTKKEMILEYLRLDPTFASGYNELGMLLGGEYNGKTVILPILDRNTGNWVRKEMDVLQLLQEAIKWDPKEAVYYANVVTRTRTKKTVAAQILLSFPDPKTKKMINKKMTRLEIAHESNRLNPSYFGGLMCIGAIMDPQGSELVYLKDADGETVQKRLNRVQMFIEAHRCNPTNKSLVSYISKCLTKGRHVTLFNGTIVHGMQNPLTPYHFSF